MAQKKDIRELLIAKATERFAEKGFTETTTKEIAEAANVNSALLYYYFKSKKDLLSVIIERAELGLLNILRGIKDKDIVPIERLTEMIKSYVRYSIENYHTTKVVIWSTDKLTGYQKKQSLSRQKEIYEIFNNEIKRIKDCGCMSEIHPQTANLIIMGMINWCPLWYKKNGILKLDEIIDQMTNGLFFGILKEEK